MELFSYFFLIEPYLRPQTDITDHRLLIRLSVVSITHFDLQAALHFLAEAVTPSQYNRLGLIIFCDRIGDTFRLVLHIIQLKIEVHVQIGLKFHFAEEWKCDPLRGTEAVFNRCPHGGVRLGGYCPTLPIIRILRLRSVARQG